MLLFTKVDQLAASVGSIFAFGESLREVYSRYARLVYSLWLWVYFTFGGLVYCVFAYGEK